MKYGLLFLALFSIQKANYAQVKSIDYSIVEVALDTSNNRNAFHCSHAAIEDTGLLENLSFWIYANSANKEYLSIQNAIDYSDVQNGLKQTSESKYSLIHKVSQPQIRDHQYLYNSPQYTTPIGVDQWPGNYNQEQIASFVDVDQNQIYEADKGDYPYIRGDQCLLSISNDETSRKSALPALQISAAQYFFIFAKSGDPILDHTIGFRWVFRNNSQNTYDSGKLGIQFHALLNKLNNNYIGTDVNNNAMYIYESGSSKNQYTSIVMLNQELSNSMYYQNTGQTANKNDIPITQQHFINYLHSKWKDGDTLKLGSTGLDGDSSIPYAFPNRTVPGYSAWTEDIVGNQGGDRNGILVTHFNNWAPGEYHVVEGAILFQTGVDSLDELYRRHAMLKYVYQNTHFSSTIYNKPNELVSIYPNPLGAKKLLSISAQNQIDNISIFSLQGKKLGQFTLNSKAGKINLNKITKQILLIKIQFSNGDVKYQRQIM